MDKGTFLSKYHRDVEILKNNQGKNEVIPQSWKDILLAPGFNENIISTSGMWLTSGLS